MSATLLLRPEPRVARGVDRRGRSNGCPLPVNILPRADLDALVADIADGTSRFDERVQAAIAAMLWGNAVQLAAYLGIAHHAEAVFLAGIAGAARGAPRFDVTRGIAASTYLGRCAMNAMRREAKVLRRGEAHEVALGDWHAAPARSDPAYDLVGRLNVREVLAMLPVDEREVLAARLGLDGGPPRTLREVALERGLSKTRVQHLEFAARMNLQKRRFRDMIRGRQNF